MSGTITPPGTGDASQCSPPMPVAVEIVLFGADGDRLRVLTIRRRWDPHAGCEALPGGLLETEGDLAEAAADMLDDVCGIRLSAEDLIEIGARNEPERGPVLSVAFGAVLPGCPPPSPGDDARNARWALADAILDDPGWGVFNHHRTVARASERLAREIEAVAPDTVPALARIQAAVTAFLGATDGLADEHALSAELEAIRESELRGLLQSLEDVRSRVAALFDETTGQIAEFAVDQADVTAVGECLEKAGCGLESVIGHLQR